jgi:hypothetical protein
MVSRGCGRRMRAILRELKKSPENKLSRPQLEDALVEVEHDRSNTLRAIRALVRAGSVIYTDARRKEDSYVRLSPPTEPLPESEVWKMLRAIMDKDRADTQKGEIDEQGIRPTATGRPGRGEREPARPHELARDERALSASGAPP